MMSLSFTIPDKIVIKLRKLSEMLANVKQIAETLSVQELEYIKRNVFISNVGASTRIENAVLTNAEIDWIDTTLSEDSKTTAYDICKELIHDKLSKDKERSIDEVVGCRAMLNLIYKEGVDLFPLTEVTIRGLHKELLRYYAKADYHSGGYKKQPNSVIRRVGKEEQPVFITASPGLETQEAMSELVKWYNEALLQHPWSVAVAVEFVFRFLAIHPFQDGNGRLARGLFNLSLLQSSDKTLSFMVPYLAIDRYIEKEREDYYYVLRRCSDGQFLRDSTKYEYEHFLRFMIDAIASAASDLSFYRNRYEGYQKLSDGARLILSCFKEFPERRLQIKMIVEQTDLPRRTVNDALNMLLDKGFIQRYGQGAGIRYQLIF